ncbi:hypothetical protein L6164_032650 [Bauhinia variegata]|uniref:Uncharacterized protein n=1 Tax=Bauhinia variegata TaxID=167791 RepID=A0ACB9KQ06_BAUVA|nr:hypothetical protein L6164_032650 [Bauhinia variegata]
MDNLYRELDELKTEMEKLKEECRVKTELVENLKKANSESFLKFQESKQQTEKQAAELDLKSEKISELRKIHEDLKSSLHEKEMCIKNLISENEKFRENSTGRLQKLEEENRELVLALDELTVKNKDLEQNVCASNKEISSLKKFISDTEKKYHAAEEKALEAKRLRQRDDVILLLEEENSKLQDKLKWKSEQFNHLEEAHEKLQDQFQKNKEEWEREKSALLEEISSLQTSLDSQTRMVEGLQSRLEMCNHALAHEESRRKLLEVEICEFKSRFQDVFTQCEEEKLKIQSLNAQRNEEMANLRNSLGEKETLMKEMEFKLVHLEQENQELGDALKELREAQIHNAGPSSLLTKLRNKLKRLEEIHKNCSSNLQSKESEWGFQAEKMKGDINAYKSMLASREQEIRELHLELENCHYTIGEISMELLVYKSEFVETCSKTFSADTVKAGGIKENEDMSLSAEQLGVEDNSREAFSRQHLKMVEELQRHRVMLEKSSEGQMVLKEQLLWMENTLKDERNVAFEALEKLNLELADKNKELSCLGCELQSWKSTAEAFKVRNEEVQQTYQKLETSLLLQVEKERALELEKESLLFCIKDQERKTEELQQQVLSQEKHNAEKMKEAETVKKEKESLVQIAEQKDCCINDLQKEITIACLKKESMRKESEAAILARSGAEKVLEQEKERLLKVKDEKDEAIRYFEKLVKSLEQDLIVALSSSFSNQVEKWVEVSVLTEALMSAEYRRKLEIEEKNTRIVKSEMEFKNLLEKVANQEESFFYLKQQAEQLQESLEDKKLETEKLKDKQRAMESMIRGLECEKEVLVQDVVRLSREREDMLVYFEDICNGIGELSGKDMQLMKTLGNLVNISVDENELAQIQQYARSYMILPDTAEMVIFLPK